MVILGAHGHSRLRDFALGSIAHDMPRDPPRDLLIARD
jgi:nucleotide-binding universal stress UspA family protein